MKTWTNPTVEELDVKLTALNIFATEPEYEQNDELELDKIVTGNPLLNHNGEKS